MKISVIIVNYKVKYYVEQCLRSVYKAFENVDGDGEVWVVDNASGDGSVEYLQKVCQGPDFPNLHIIANDENLGFGRANNMAIEMAQGEYVLLLNPDTLLTETTLKDCIDFAETKDDFGALGVKMLHDNGRFALESRRGLPTPWTAFCKMSGLTALFPHSRTFGKYYMRYLDKNEPNEIEIISGAFLLTKKAVLDKVGTFDEQFFMYGEDIDLSYRIVQGGFKNYYVPTPIIHYKGESTHKSSWHYVYVFYEAMHLFFRKHYKSASIFLSIPIYIAIVGRAAIALCAQYLRKLKKWLCPKSRKKKVVDSLYFGRPSEALDALAKHYDIRIEAADKPTHEGHTCHIYNTSDYTYSTMLQSLEKSDHKHYLGVFHPENNALITGGDVYVMDNE